MYRRSATDGDDGRNKRSQWAEEHRARGGIVRALSEHTGNATRAALATVGQQRMVPSEEGLQARQLHHSGNRNREMLPSLDHVLSKRPSAAEPENIVCSQSMGNSPGVSSTAVPSENSSVPSSRRSSASVRSHMAFGDLQRSNPAGTDATAMLRQPARSQSVGGTSSRSLSRATSGSRTPQPHGRSRGADGFTPELGSRAASGSRTPDPGVNRMAMVPPLTSAQLESASQKLKNLDVDQRPATRTGWDGEEQEQAQRDASRAALSHLDFSSDRGVNATLSSVLPVAPNGFRESKSRQRPGRTFSGSGERPSSRSGQQGRATSSSHTIGDNGSSNTGSAASSSGLGSQRLLPRDARHQTNPRLHLRNGSRDDSFLSTISESTRSSDSTSTDRDSKINVLDGSQIEVYSENQSADRRLYVDVLKDFKQLFALAGEKEAEQMQHLLRNHSFDKPLETQRRIIPLISSAFQDEQKSFITVQGAPQCGKTSALALGILGAVGSDTPGIRAIALSTGPVRDFKKCFDICAEVHPISLICFESTKRRVSFEGVDPDPDTSLSGMNLTEDMQRLSSELVAGAPGMIFGHPSRVLPLLREAPSWGIDLSNVQVLALDDAEEAICQGLIDEVCEVCTILRHFSKQRLRHIILSHFLSNEAKSMVRCLRTSLLRQQNLFGIRAHRTQARAKAVNHYYAVAPRSRWPAMLAVLHHALSLPSGIIFDDESADARAHTRVALRSLGVTASVWNALQEQRSGARAAARDGAAGTTPKGPAFHLMPSDLVVLKVDLPQVRCVLHFEVPRRELSIYGLRLMCLEQQEKKASRKAALGGKSLSVLFVEEAEVVRELEKTFHIRMHEVPTEMLPS